MQQNSKQTTKGYWVITLPNSQKVVSNIVKMKDGLYGLTIDMSAHKSFMKALSALADFYSHMMDDNKTPVQEFHFAGISLKVTDYSADNKSFSTYEFKTGKGAVFLSGGQNTFFELLFHIQEKSAEVSPLERLNYARAEALCANLA